LVIFFLGLVKFDKDNLKLMSSPGRIYVRRWPPYQTLICLLSFGFYEPRVQPICDVGT